MYKYIMTVLLVFSLSACTVLKVVQVDPMTGYFPSNKKATVLISKPLDLDISNALILVPNDDFTKGLVVNIGYFREVMTFDDLQKRVIAANLTDKIPSINDRIGVNNAAKYYKDFLWLRYNKRGEGINSYIQLILTDPITMEDYFSTETYLDFIWTGVNDQNNFYPMFNAFIDYIKQNSKSYKK